MTREEAIRFLNEQKEFLLKGAFWEETRMNINEAFGMAIEALKGDVPDIKVEEWIQVSKKPKTSGYYNCTCYDGVTRRVTTLKWSNGWMLSGRRSYWKVLAWMPLPKPYTEEEK